MSRRIYTEIINPNGNFLFTVDDLNNADSRTKCLPCKCLHCSKIFYISKHEYQKTICNSKCVSFKCCCLTCYNRFKITKQTVTCVVCGKPLTRVLSQIKQNNFCSHSCAATFNNTHRIRSEASKLKTSKRLVDFYTLPNSKLPSTKFFHSGYHTSWEGKKFYYRSSYELDYCIELDKQKIPYEMETLRIRYFNTRKNREAVAIPDFYLKDSNTIVEIKSEYTYNQQDMIDRVIAYKQLGYNFKLILEHVEYTDCPPNTSTKTLRW